MQTNSQTLLAKPAASVPVPAAGSVVLFLNSANNNISQKDSAGAVLDLAVQATGGGGASGASLGILIATHQGITLP